MRLLEDVVKESSKSLWKKIGEKALTKAVTTLVGEVIKAAVDIKKRAKLREDKAAFDADRKKKKSKSSKSKKAKSNDTAPDNESEGDEVEDDRDDELGDDEEAAEKDSPERPDDRADEENAHILSFDDYVAGRS